MSNVAIATANIDVAQIMSHEDNKNAVEQIRAAFESNPAVSQMLDAAQSVEDMYEAIKEYFSLKLEDFKVMYDKAVDFLKSPKAKLEDDVMECVIGGSWSSVWNGFKKTACAVAVVTAMSVLGGAVGVGIGMGVIALAGIAPKVVGTDGGVNKVDGAITGILLGIDTINDVISGRIFKRIFHL